MTKRLPLSMAFALTAQVAAFVCGCVIIVGSLRATFRLFLEQPSEGAVGIEVLEKAMVFGILRDTGISLALLSLFGAVATILIWRARARAE